MNGSSYFEDETSTVNPRSGGHFHNRGKVSTNRKRSSVSKVDELSRITELPKLMEDKDKKIKENWEIELNATEEFSKLVKETDQHLQKNCEIFLPKRGGYLDRTLQWIQDQRTEALNLDTASLPDFSFIPKQLHDSVDSCLQSDEKAYALPYSPSKPPVKRSEPLLRAFDTSGLSNGAEKKKTAYEKNHNSKAISIKKNKENINNLMNMMNPKKYLEEMFESPPRHGTSRAVKKFDDSHIDVDRSSLLEDYGARRSFRVCVESPNKSLKDGYFDDIASEETVDEVVQASTHDNFPDFENFIINPIKPPEIKFYPRALF